jgi:ferredoxin
VRTEEIVKVTVDQDLCVGSGQCALTADDVFDQSDEDGTVVLLNATPPADRKPDIQHAAALCPAAAITLEE